MQEMPKRDAPLKVPNQRGTYRAHMSSVRKFPAGQP